MGMFEKSGICFYLYSVYIKRKITRNIFTSHKVFKYVPIKDFINHPRAHFYNILGSGHAFTTYPGRDTVLRHTRVKSEVKQDVGQNNRQLYYKHLPSAKKPCMTDAHIKGEAGGSVHIEVFQHEPESRNSDEHQDRIVVTQTASHSGHQL